MEEKKENTVELSEEKLEEAGGGCGDNSAEHEWELVETFSLDSSGDGDYYVYYKNKCKTCGAIRYSSRYFASSVEQTLNADDYNHARMPARVK